MEAQDVHVESALAARKAMRMADQNAAAAADAAAGIEAFEVSLQQMGSPTCTSTGVDNGGTGANN
jgi:hypothetical protein